MNSLITSTVKDLTVRAMAPSDLDAVLRIAGDCPEARWPREEIRECFRSADSVGKVAEIRGQVVGYLVYRLDRSLREVFIKNMAVAPAWRRRGIGRVLLGSLDALLHGRYERIRALLPETSVPLQLLLRDGKFRAVRVLRGWYGDEHAYLMEKRVNSEE
jgi:ribosomal protein S18 acetylase RimI-like enzyme